MVLEKELKNSLNKIQGGNIVTEAIQRDKKFGNLLMKIKEAYDEYLGNTDGQVEIKQNYKELIEEKNKEVEGHRRNLERERSLGLEKRAVISTLQDEVNDLKIKLVDRDS